MIMKRKTILSKTEILIFLLMFPIIKPDSIREIAPLMDTLFDIGRLISVFLVLIMYCSTLGKKTYLRSSLWILVLLEVWIVFVTAINNPDRLFASLINGSAIITTSMLVETFSRSDTKALLRALMANFEWVVYVNLLTHILYPEGLYQFRGHPYYFFGSDNVAIKFLLPAVVLSYLNYVCIGSRFRPALLSATSIVTVIIGRSATAKVSFITLAFVFILLSVKKSIEQFKLSYIWIVSLVFNLLISIVRIMDVFPPFKYFIKNILGKSTTLSGRTYVWDQALRYWARYPLIGNGYDTTLPFEASYVSHAHNAYLQYLLISGIIGLIIFVVFNLLSISNFDVGCGASRSGKGCKAAFAALFVAYVAEPCNYPMLFILYALADSIIVFNALEYR